MAKFVKAYYEKPEDYLKDLQQDIIINVSTVHDEVNLGVEKFLLKPILKKIINLYTVKKIMDRFGYNYMNFLYDSEFNLTTGAFSGEGYKGVDGFSPYTYPLDREEAKAKKEFLTLVEELKPKEEEKELVEESQVKSKIYTIKYKKLKNINLKDFHKKDGDLLRVKKDGKTLEYNFKINYKKLQKHLNR